MRMKVAQEAIWEIISLLFPEIDYNLKRGCRLKALEYRNGLPIWTESNPNRMSHN